MPQTHRVNPYSRFPNIQWEAATQPGYTSLGNMDGIIYKRSTNIIVCQAIP